MVIGYGALENRRVTWLDAVRYVAVHARGLIRLGLVALVRLLPVAALFVAGVGGIYVYFIGEHDINCYFAHKTPELGRALALAAIVVAVLAIVVLRLLPGWLLALPLTLVEGIDGREALRESVRRTRGLAWGIVMWLAAWLAFLWVVSSTVALLFGQLGSLLVTNVRGDNFPVIVAGIALTLLFTVLANLAVTTFTTSFLPLVLLRLYRSLGGFRRLALQRAVQEPLGKTPSFQVPGKETLWAAGATFLAVNMAGCLAIVKLDADEEVVVIAHRGASVAGDTGKSAPNGKNRSVKER